jgi:excisionase family DNA binding protein
VIYNVSQVAELLECTEETVVERINAGELPGAKFGRGWVIPADALRVRLNEIALEHASQRRQGAQPPAAGPRRKPIPALPVKALLRDPRP